MACVQQRVRRFFARLGGVLVLAAVTLHAAPAFAGGSKELNSVLGNIEWGDGKDEVIKKLKQQMFGKLRERDDLRHDRVKMQKARERVKRRYERIKNSYTELEEGDSSYKVSVIADEFTRGNNESLLKVEDQAAQRFYFFADGTLYKLVVAYKQGYLSGVGFRSFVSQVSGKYGEPVESEVREINGEKTPARAVWKSDETILTAKNQREFFGTFSLVFADRKRVKKLRAKNDAFGGSEKDASEVSKRVESLKKGSSNDPNADVVDGMVGKEVELDMKKNAKLEDQGPEAETNRKGAGEKAEQKKKRAEKKKTKEKTDEKEEEKEQNREFQNLSADKKKKEGDGDLIVY